MGAILIQTCTGKLLNAHSGNPFEGCFYAWTVWENSLVCLSECHSECLAILSEHLHDLFVAFAHHISWIGFLALFSPDSLPPGWTAKCLITAARDKG